MGNTGSRGDPDLLLSCVGTTSLLRKGNIPKKLGRKSAAHAGLEAKGLVLVQATDQRTASTRTLTVSKVTTTARTAGSCAWALKALLQHTIFSEISASPRKGEINLSAISKGFEKQQSDGNFCDKRKPLMGFAFQNVVLGNLCLSLRSPLQVTC